MFGHDSTTGERQEFDHVIVASGFFGAPRMPKDESGNSLRPERDVGGTAPISPREYDLESFAR